MRSTRLRRHVTLDAASAATHIKLSYLEALEDGNYAVLPGTAYIVGFLRNYARFLGLHPDDVVQEFHSAQPAPQPHVKAATRVLASGHDRQNRSKLLWSVVALFAMLAAGFAIKQYNDTYAHASSPPLSVTATNLGAPAVLHPARPRKVVSAIALRLKPMSPVWVRVTSDNRRVFQGMLQGRARLWHARRGIYVMTFDGTHLRASIGGRSFGILARQAGPGVWAATSAGWHRVS